jgi:hypothetical protein
MVNRRPRGLRQRFARKTTQPLLGGFGGKMSKTARKSTGG